GRRGPMPTYCIVPARYSYTQSRSAPCRRTPASKRDILDHRSELGRARPAEPSRRKSSKASVRQARGAALCSCPPDLRTKFPLLRRLSRLTYEGTGPEFLPV